MHVVLGDVHWAHLEASALGSLIAACPAWKRREREEMDLHWLRIQEWIQYKLCVLVFNYGKLHAYEKKKKKCKHNLAPAYLSEQLQQVAQLESRQRLRSSSSSAFVVPATRRSMLGDWSFSAAGTRAWNRLPPTVTAASTLSSFRRYLKSHLFTKSFPLWQ